MHPAHVSAFFLADGKYIYRRLLRGASKRLRTMEGGRLVVYQEGERLQAKDIAWCLHYGNWPKFPLVQLSGDPHDCSIENLMPARLRRLRYRETQKGGLFYHPLAQVGLSSPGECHADWVLRARDEYQKDLGNVLRIEAEERQLRKNADEPVPELPGRRAAKPVKLAAVPVGGKPPKPAHTAGFEHHYFDHAWVTIPVAVHPSDDWMVRLRKWQAGAVRFAFQPVYGETWGFRADGTVVL